MNWIRVIIPAIELATGIGGLRKPANVVYPNNPPISQKEIKMNFLSGYKTYIMGAIAILNGLAGFAGIKTGINSDPASSIQSIWAGLTAIFLRSGMPDKKA